jgi:hypothetical protein
MKSSRRLVAVAVAVVVLTATEASAAGVDFKDPRRALGREDDIRVDAQLAQDTVSSSSPISVTYQIENLTNAPIAIADRVCSSSFDPETRTITISIGAEIPQGTAMPHLVIIAAGKKLSLRTGAMVQVAVVSTRTPWSPVPSLVQITVNVLRDLQPFATLIEQQSHAAIVPLPDNLFDQWVSSISSVALNSLPVRWTNSPRAGTAETSRAAAGGGY